MDLVFVAGIINKLIGNIMASPKIKTPADLKGKKIGLPFPYAAALLLAAAGVLAMGLWPEPFMQWAMNAAHVLI